MNVNFELYRIFYTVALNESISKAASELYISQPAVSKAIKKLEDELGGSVFIRTKKGVILTEEGKELFNYVKNAMEYLKGAEDKFKDMIKLEVGTIRIGINTTLARNFLMPYLKEFHSLHSKINIEIITGANKFLMNKLSNGLIDLMVLNLPFKTINDIKIVPCQKVTDCFVVNSNFIELTKKTLSLKDLNNYPLILQAKGSNTRNHLDLICNKYNVALKPIVSLTSYSLVKDLAEIGFGIGYLHKEFIKEELESKKLYELKIKETIPARSIGIAYSNKIVSFAVKELINIIKKNS